MLEPIVNDAGGGRYGICDGAASEWLDMKVNDPNLSSLASTGASRTTETARSGQPAKPADQAGGASGGDEIHLSELVRNLRALAAGSPERQARVEQIARDYANGNYKVDAAATASGIIDDGIQHS